MEGVSCEREAHTRPGYVRIVVRFAAGWELECGHYAVQTGDIVHCQCGATLVRCAVCSIGAGRGLTGREYLKRKTDGDPDVR
jgi:hypothetical protein